MNRTTQSLSQHHNGQLLIFNCCVIYDVRLEARGYNNRSPVCHVLSVANPDMSSNSTSSQVCVVYFTSSAVFHINLRCLSLFSHLFHFRFVSYMFILCQRLICVTVYSSVRRHTSQVYMQEKSQM